MKIFETKREGQMAFFDNYGIPYSNDDSISVDNADGVYNGNLLEFKLTINDLEKVLFQAIKYLSKMRIKGESVPANILLIDLNHTKAYLYYSEDYRNVIQQVYVGAASKSNQGFVAGIPAKIYDYSNMIDSSSLKRQLKESKQELYMPIDIDENCIVGWGERYYREVPKATKGDFLGDDNGLAVSVKGEIREPVHFKGYIRPYTGKTNEKFKYLMDCLNNRLSKKDLGAFYTPLPYAKKSAELVEIAVKRVLDAGKKDYIILDRCAGTGNLESALIGLTDQNGDDLISHCIVSTYEYYEYKVLNERIGDLVRDIIPPTEADVVYANGKVSNADAMSEDFIKNPIIQQYLDDEDCAVIMFENPPYRDQSAKNNKKETKNSKHTDKSFIREKMKSEKKYGLAVNDLLNLFVYSAWKYYLRQDTDSYIIFAPIKHWKRIGISNKHYVDGFIFNRKYFHATAEAISCMYFTNENAQEETAILHAIDIDECGRCILIKDVSVSKSHNVMSKLFDKRNLPDDDYEKAICCNRDGTEAFRDCHFKPYYNDNMVAYLRAESYGFDANSICLVRNGLYNGHGFYLRNDNYLNGLPMFVAKLYPFDEWYMKNMIDTTSDDGDKYTHDPSFLKSCLIYTCLSNQNKCLSFEGSDGRRYQNELCFEHSVLAWKDLEEYKKRIGLDEDEDELISLWEKILGEAKDTDGYNPEFRYGVYQIAKELNTFEKIGTGKNKKTVYNYPILNDDLDTLRTKLKEYYKSHITEKMFKYKLIK